MVFTVQCECCQDLFANTELNLRADTGLQDEEKVKLKGEVCPNNTTRTRTRTCSEIPIQLTTDNCLGSSPRRPPRSEIPVQLC